MLKLIAAVLYAFAFWVGVPLLIVGSAMAITHLLGTGFAAGVAAAFVCLPEFVLSLCFFAWQGNPILCWIDSD